MDRSREMKKGVMAESLIELIERGKKMLNYPQEKKVYVVLEEDGTEVDEEEYFQTLPENTLLMILHVGDKWSPFGPPFTLSELLENEIQVLYSDKFENEISSSTSSLLMLTLKKLCEDPNFFSKSEILSFTGYEDDDAISIGSGSRGPSRDVGGDHGRGHEGPDEDKDPSSGIGNCFCEGNCIAAT
ncbi:DFFA [Lepeophtheirus salmonis]|uniref:DFFA n=1 Tax=Lepeophtheirus salmonis TaxID=72036 RepID=A0A7R8CMQ9_LEPSM|nr:DFFA [Lepeophtheirus salmonis]CAF2868474.1 DFFA [Lepeophtheirus salmonis]